MMTVENFKRYLTDKGLNPNKTFGQNFLINDIVLHDIVDGAEIKNTDTVVEVGPGIGNMTQLLSAKAKKVVCVEKDTQFKKLLSTVEAKSGNVKVMYGDILSTNFWGEISGEYIVVANIPYYITGKIIQLFLRAERKPRSVTLLTQKEVAENMVAKPGKLNLLGVSVQLIGEASILQVVPSRDFFPPPKVTSAVVKIILSPKPKLPINEEEKFFKLLHAAFLGKRKQIHNTLTNNLTLPKEEIISVLNELGIKEQSRPQELSVDDWIRLFEKLKAQI